MGSPITTHVLDTAEGRPAQGIEIVLEISDNGGWKELGRGVTNADGRVADLLPDDHQLEPGVYQMTFHTGAYRKGGKGFYPYVPVVFELQAPGEHYHVPLLLNPYGYSTYRGS